MIYLLLFYKHIIGSSGAMHLCMFSSTVDASLRWFEIFGLALASASLIGIGRRGGFSSHIIPNMYIRVGYLTSLGLFIFTRWIYNTLEFWRKLEDYALLLEVLLLIFDVRRFLEEAPKLSEKFLLMLPTFSKRKLWKRWISCWLFLHEMAYSVPSNTLGGIRSCRWIVW